MVGALLRFTEFVGIVDGLAISLIAFVVYLHPVWTIIFDRWLNSERITPIKVFKIGIAVVSIALLLNVEFAATHNLWLLWGPIAAGMLVSLWICLSNTAQKKGASVITVSFYYDLFSLIPLVGFAAFTMTPSQINHSWQWLLQLKHFGMIVGFSIVTGFVANYIFYSGLKRSDSLIASLLMLFEPVISSLISVSVWHEPISKNFVWGALGVLCLNIPDRVFLAFKAKTMILFDEALGRKQPIVPPARVARIP